MKASITNGTLDFLKTLQEKYSDLPLRLMSSKEGGLAYYEHQNKTIFQSGRTYEILSEIGEVQESGYIVMNNIPVPEESQPVFEDRFVHRQHAVETMPGFQGFRFLKPQKGNTYIVLTQWGSVKDFENWKNSPEFAEAHKKQSAKPSAHFSEKPYVSTYSMYTVEEEE